MVYNFKSITVVQDVKSFIDFVLSKTNRRTPTVIHPQYEIHRIRKFYMRKVKFCQSLIHDKISKIIDDFPRLEDIHPFYGDLLNVLYDKDHYKLALGQLNTCRHLIDGIGRDYLRLLKYGDSLYRCKQLKRAALGRMVTLLKKQGSSLAYLEQVRQHLSRLPDIDPKTRTLILTGYPNVGKSSFMNKITRAQVDVQSYAFTTKSIFVGHTDYKCLRWQVLDTPGILDHPLEERNTIEMQSITALAHLRACILFLIDVSGHCGYSIQQQVELFKNIKPLFTNKPIIIVMTKSDLKKYQDLTEDEKSVLEEILSDGHEMVALSNATNEGIADVKQTACDKLLEHRVQSKLSKGGKRLEDILQRVHLAKPIQRDEKKRDVSIPQSVIEKMNNKDDEMEVEKVTEKVLEQKNGGAGVHQTDFRKRWLLKNEEWKYDKIPEIVDGKNIADYVDPEILKKLDELEKEEEERLKKDEGIDFNNEEFYIDPEKEKEYKKIKDKLSIIKQKREINRTSSLKLPQKYKPIPLSEITKELKSRGVDKETLERAKSNTRTLSKSRARSKSRSLSVISSRSVSTSRVLSEREKLLNSETNKDSLLGKRKRQFSANDRRSLSVGRLAGFKDPRKLLEAKRIGDKRRKLFTVTGKKGESDRTIYDLMPKHLFSGKRGIGKANSR